MKTFITLLAAISLAGCATTYQAPQTYNVEEERVINEPYDTVWNRAIEWFALNASPVKNTDKQSGFVASALNFTTSSYPQYCDCGSGVAGLYLTVAVVNRVGNFNVLFRRIDDNNTRVTVISAFHAKVVKQLCGEYATSYKDINCNSKGLLEKQILDYLAAKQ